MVNDPDDEREGRGRSAKRREAQAIEVLAVRLVESGDAFCRRLPLTDELREELRLIWKLKARGALKRQIKHLAGLLRNDQESVTAIQAALEAVGRTNRTERDGFHRIEQLRDALCDPDGFAEALERVAGELPGLNRQTFTRLAQRVHETGDKGASREIFRRLRALTEATAETSRKSIEE